MYVTVRGSGRYVGRTRLRDRVRHISLSESQCKHHNPLQEHLGSSGNMAELRMRIQHAPLLGPGGSSMKEDSVRRAIAPAAVCDVLCVCMCSLSAGMPRCATAGAESGEEPAV